MRHVLSWLPSRLCDQNLIAKFILCSFFFFQLHTVFNAERVCYHGSVPPATTLESFLVLVRVWSMSSVSFLHQPFSLASPFLHWSQSKSSKWFHNFFSLSQDFFHPVAHFTSSQGTFLALVCTCGAISMDIYKRESAFPSCFPTCRMRVEGSDRGTEQEPK